jgi:hypothetical protein
MHRILFLPDIRPAGYPDTPKAGYRISGKGRIPDIRPETWLGNYIFLLKTSNKFIKTALTIIRDAPDIRPAGYPAFFYIRYPAGYQIALPDIRPDIR